MTYCYKRMLKFYDNVERKVGIRRMNWDKFVEDFRGYITNGKNEVIQNDFIVESDSA